MGNLRLAYLRNMLRSWIGAEGDITRVGCQYRALNFRHGVLTAYSKITRKYQADGECLVDLDIWVENQHGENACPGAATVRLPSPQG